MMTQEKITTPPPPQTVRTAVEQLLALLSPAVKEAIGNTPKGHLPELQRSLGAWVGKHFGLWHQNQVLLDSCKIALGIHPALPLSPEHASGVIVESLWEQLQEEKGL